MFDKILLNNDLKIEMMTSKGVIEAISYIYVNVADIQQTNTKTRYKVIYKNEMQGVAISSGQYNN